MSRTPSRETSQTIHNDSCVECSTTAIASIGSSAYTFAIEDDVYTLNRYSIEGIEELNVFPGVPQHMCAMNSTLYVSTEDTIYSLNVEDETPTYDELPDLSGTINGIFCASTGLFYSTSGGINYYPWDAIDKAPEPYASTKSLVSLFFIDIRSGVIVFAASDSLLITKDNFKTFDVIATGKVDAIHAFVITPGHRSKLGIILAIVVSLIPLYGFFIWAIYAIVKAVCGCRSPPRYTTSQMTTMSSNNAAADVDTMPDTMPDTKPNEDSGKKEAKPKCSQCFSEGNMAFIAPCGDVVVCIECATQLKDLGQTCPKCFGAIDSVWPAKN